MKIVKSIAKGVLFAGMVTGVSTASFAGGHGFKCKVSEESMAKPGGFPDRALTMIVPYGLQLYRILTFKTLLVVSC